MLASGNGLIASAIITYVLVALCFFAFTEAYQRRKQARLGHRRPVWLMVLFALLVSPFAVIQIIVVGCVGGLQLGLFGKLDAAFSAQLLVWLLYGLWVVLLAAAGWGLLSMRRAGR